MVPSWREAQRTRETVSLRWGVTPRPELFADADWEPVLAALRDGIVDRGHVTVVAPDGDADYIWTESGAQPVSLWLPGSIKLGFDPKAETGLSYLERVRRSEAAFHEGLAACADSPAPTTPRSCSATTARSLGTFDVRPSARYRKDPKDRTAASLQREVAPSIIYDDRNLSEVLVVFPGATLPLGFHSDAVKLVDVVLEPMYPDVFMSPNLTLTFPDGTVIQPTHDAARPQLVSGCATARRTECPRVASINVQDRTSIVADHRLRGRPGIPRAQARDR